MKANKIQLDHIKQGCQCVFFQGRSKKYITEECEFCKRNKKNNLIDSEYGNEIYVLNNDFKSHITDSILNHIEDIKFVFLKRRVTTK